MKVNVFSATCITNLHVGNGEVNYNIIDQEVEKDPVTGLPMINSSGVKGAIREFFETQWRKDERRKDEEPDPRIINYFGGKNGESSTQGCYKFLQMDMLYRPLRVTDDSAKSYILATTEEIIDDFAEKVKMLSSTKIEDNNTEKKGDNTEGKNNKKITDGFDAFMELSEKDSISIEGTNKDFILKRVPKSWSAFANDTVAVVDSLKRYDLPVIARNMLDDNGISKNLWYEEYVPHRSVFGLIILTPEEMDNDFKGKLTAMPVQFGGNASIGYGLMSIKEVPIE